MTYGLIKEAEVDNQYGRGLTGGEHAEDELVFWVTVDGGQHSAPLPALDSRRLPRDPVLARPLVTLTVEPTPAAPAPPGLSICPNIHTHVAVSCRMDKRRPTNRSLCRKLMSAKKESKQEKDSVYLKWPNHTNLPGPRQ